METNQQKRLASIHNRRTAYEVVIYRGEAKFLVGYTRKGKRGILALVRIYGDRIAKLATCDRPSSVNSKSATCGEWTICFTGRTERDAILEEEIPRVPS